MSLQKTGFKPYYFISISLLFLILFACSNTQFSNIQNIRQIETSVDFRDRTEFTLMTFNIRAGGGTTNPKQSPYRVIATEENLIKISEAIKSVESDIVGLQEVRGYNQAKFLAEKLNMNFAYIPHGRRQNWWGLAILSKYEILEMQGKSVSHRDDQRIGQICKLEINERAITVINLHVSASDHPRVKGRSSYKEQFDAITKILANMEGPIVLMGDLNRNPTEPILKPIQEKLLDVCLAINPEEHCWVRDRGTMSWHPDRHVWIDYIFINSKFFKAKKVGLVPEKHWDASDHKAFFAEVILKDSFAD